MHAIRCFFVRLMLLTGLTLALAAARAQPAPQVLTTDALRALIDAKSAGLVVVDTRNPEEFQEVHIRDAINIPVAQMEKNPALLTMAKDTKLVFYCNGVKCGKSARAAKVAQAAGFSNILIYAEGMPVWEEKGLPIYAGPDYEKKIETAKLSPAQLDALMKSQPAAVTVVDVRDPSEFAAGHIPGAINLPAAEFAAASGSLDKAKRIVVYCNSGGRSYNAYRKLQKLAYPNIAQALYADWRAAQLPVETSACGSCTR